MTTSDAEAAGVRLEILAASLGTEVVRATFLPDPGRQVSGVQVYEGGSPRQPGPGAIALAIGIAEAHSLARLLGRLSGVAAVAVKCRAQDDAEVLGAAAEHGCSVLVLNDGVDWLQAVALLQAEIARATGTADAAGRGAVLDLFELADLAADAVGGPVTIEDPHGWLLAYSHDQAGSDPLRAETLLNRRAPADFADALAACGLRQEIGRSVAPVLVCGVTGNAADRLATRLHAGGFTLGAMWAVVAGPTEAQAAAFAGIGQQVSVHLMRRRTEDHRTRQVELEQLAVLLHGGPAVTGADELIDLPRGRHWVAALSLAPTDPADRAVARTRLEHNLALLPRTGTLTVHAGQLSNLWYLILTATGEFAAEAVRDWVGALLTDGSGARLPVRAGLGSSASTREELPRSRKEAERALAVARLSPVAGTVSGFADCWAQAALIRLLDPTIVADLDSTTPLWQLREQDLAHGTDHLLTLHTWLEHQGNIRTAADQLHIHPNTLRYRMTKIEQTAGINLADADARLVLALQLKGTYGAQPARG